MHGFIPAGWYPTAARVLPSGALVVLNGKGLRSYPNPHGPSPARRPEPLHEGTPVERVRGATCRPARPPGSSRSATASSKTGPPAALANSPYRDSNLDETSPLPHIEHVIYIVKENRTYDQVLGDMKEGNGDASLVLFGENVTPNLHKLAREFVLLDNFYVNADVSADGHNWSTAAIAPDYVEKLWPNNYAHRAQGLRLRRAGPGLAAARRIPVDQRRRGRPSRIRNFGYMVDNGSRRGRRRRADRGSARPGAGQGDQPRSIAASTWTIRTSSGPRSSCASSPNTRKPGNMPQLIVMRLGNDHTSAPRPAQLRRFRWRPITITRWA